LWDKLTKIQKQELIHKYIDTIEFTKDKEITITNINFNAKEIANIGYMFRKNYFDMLIPLEDKNVILSNTNTKEDLESYIENLSQFYKIKPSDELILNETMHIIPNTKEHRLAKQTYTLLEIGT